MKILIAGDFFVSDQYSNQKLIDHSVLDLFHKADFRIVNLEAPFTDDNPKNKIIKTGPHLRMSEKTIDSQVKQLDINVVTMANNHILDYGNAGLIDTFEILQKHNILYVGAGKNLKDAAKPLIIGDKSLKIAIINICETEWSIADNDSPGANPMHIIDNIHQIHEARKHSDYVILIIHGGHEHFNLPSPRMQKQYRFYAEQGCDLVVGHHTHCISGYEVYKDVPIYYSLGNFLFPRSTKTNEDWYKGLILEIDILNDKIYHKVHFVEQNIDNYQLKIQNVNERRENTHLISSYNEIITDGQKLESEWSKYKDNQFYDYLKYWNPVLFINNKYFRRIFNKVGFNKYVKRIIAYHLNLIQCESHRDLTQSILMDFLKCSK